MKSLNKEQERVLKKLLEIEKELPTGVSLTFAVDNLVEIMEESESQEFLGIIYSLIECEFLAKHTERETDNRIPFWLEITNRAREYVNIKK